MRLYNKQKQKLIKIVISKQKSKSETITVSDSDIDEVIRFIKKSVPEIALSTPQGYRTSIMAREYEDGKFLESRSTSIYGSDPIDVKEFLEEKIREFNRLPLPDILYYDGDVVRCGVEEDSDVTEEWKKFVNINI